MYNFLLQFCMNGMDYSISSNEYLFDRWLPDFHRLFPLYNDKILKKEYVDILKEMTDSYEEITVLITEEEYFYLKLKYPNEIKMMEEDNHIERNNEI